MSKKRIETSKVEIDLEELKDLIRMLRENNVYEFEYNKGDYHVRIKHGVLIEPVMPGNPAAAGAPLDVEKVVSAAAMQKAILLPRQSIASSMASFASAPSVRAVGKSGKLTRNRSSSSRLKTAG